MRTRVNHEVGAVTHLPQLQSDGLVFYSRMLLSQFLTSEVRLVFSACCRAGAVRLFCVSICPLAR